MLLEKDKYCCCPNCGCKEFKDISVVVLTVMKNEFNDEMMYPQKFKEMFKCIRCGKEFSAEEIYNHYKGE